MAMGSHEDNQYKLLIENATHTNSTPKQQTSYTPADEEAECAVLSSSTDSPTPNTAEFYGSSRRKYSCFSKGITIEEFLETQNTWQPSAIDKLLLKNKVALAESQMKQTKLKTVKKLPNTNKTETSACRKGGGKIISSKIASKKKSPGVVPHSSQPKKKNEAVKVRKPKDNNEAAVKPAPANGMERKPKKLKVVSNIGKNRNNVIKNAANKRARAIPNNRPRAQIAKRQFAEVESAEVRPKPVKSVKESDIKVISVKSDNSASTVKINRLKKEIKTRIYADRNISSKKASYETRGSREKLRNGKTRILKEKNQSIPSPKRRSIKRVVDNESSNTTLVTGTTTTTKSNDKGSATAKRVHIKEEPLEEVMEVKRKRRKIENSEETVPEDIKPIIKSVESLISDETDEFSLVPQNGDIIKEEVAKPIKKEKEQESVVEEINVVNKELINPTNAENIYVYGNISSETASMIPNGYILQDLGSYVKEMEKKNTKLESTPEKDTESKTIIFEETIQVTETTKVETILASEMTLESVDMECEEFPLLISQTDTDDALEESLSIQFGKESTDVEDQLQIVENGPDEVVDLEDSIGDACTVEANSVPAASEAELPLVDDTVHISDDDSCGTDLDEPVLIKDDEPAEANNETEISENHGAEEAGIKSNDEENTKDSEELQNPQDKESILKALGLQSLEKVNQKTKENYTGTLKAVIKTDKGCRRMELKQKENTANVEGFQNETVLSFYSKTIQSNNLLEEGNPSKPNVEKSSENTKMDAWYIEESENGGNSTKTHEEITLLSSVRETDASTEEVPEYSAVTEDADSQLAKDKNKGAASLVVPEKSSSFSIHPNRLCSDVCKYCFGKFGSLDTPCHVAQLKNPERQRKILLCEPNLKTDTCLCDACYRYVDRKANKPPTKRNKNIRRNSISINQRAVCAIQNCNQFARHSVKRKWLLKISKKIAKLSFDANKRGPRMMYGLCSQHYYLVDFYTLCGVCKKRLNRNHMYSISEINVMNDILKEDNIPVKLVDNMLLCKLCHYYMSLRLKYGDSSKMSPSNRQYYQNFKKKVLIYYNVIASDSEDTTCSEGLKSENGENSSPERSSARKTAEERANENKEPLPETEPKKASSGKKSHNVGIHDIASLLKPLEGDGDKSSTRIQVKFGNLNIGKLSNLNIGQNTSTELKTEKSADKELPLIADFSFETPAVPQSNWEKCISTILFDKGTKKLWQDLQKPYGNQSSFIRHLIMLEKYWRSGALVLSESADPGAMKYINSVKNRISSLETLSSSSSSSSSVAPASTPQKRVVQPPTPTPPPPPPPPSIEPVLLAPPPPPAPKPQQQTVSKSSTPPVLISGFCGTTRRTPEPPPLLKLKTIPAGMPRTSSEYCISTKPTISAINVQPRKGVITATGAKVFVNNELKMPQVSLNQYKEMMHPQPRIKQLMQVGNVNGHILGVSLLKKPASFNNAVTVTGVKTEQYSPVQPLVSTVTKRMGYSESSSSVSKGSFRGSNTNYSMLRPNLNSNNFNSSVPVLPKLPKALTVVQVMDTKPLIEIKVEDPPTHITSPFLAGEKPSITVFREISK